MTTNEIRKKFLDFFKSKGHKIVKSDSLVPKDDPTVLFTTAGMQQFKRQFLGNIDDFSTAATSQKCLRTDDLDEVGKTDFHHTFFEMLGNFSFGDYFKKEAICWAWEFLTQVLKIDEKRLWVSVYKDDNEAYSIWKDEIKLPEHKIFKLGDKSNFWPANAKEKGPNGPCGPCSEIFYDYAPEDKTIPKDPDDIEGRFSEVWNLVFTQFERKDGGELVPLPNKNIDTGMGLERLASVMQGVKNNFDTDIFAPIMKSIEKEIEGKNKLEIRNKRVIADHIRAIVFGISDGVVPSNEGRGYIMKKLIAIVSDIAQFNASHKPCIYKLVDSVVESMGENYPEIKKNAKNIATSIKNVEEAYIKLRQERLPKLEDALLVIKKGVDEPKKQSIEVGNLMFKYRDTYGLSLDTMRGPVMTTFNEWDENEWDKTVEIYTSLMKKQQERSRAGSNISKDVFTGTELELNVPKTEFLGHKHASIKATILKLFIDNKKVRAVKKGDKAKVLLDKSPFYAESGGQIGDTGTITIDDNKIIVEDTQKQDDIFIHSGYVESGKFDTNDHVIAEIDSERRLAIMRNHTATHLLQAALRKVIGEHVQQQGSYVSDDRLRFDFTHHKAVTKDQLVEIEKVVNKYIVDCETVTKEYLSANEAKESGALAFFAEKYGEVVRVVSIGNISKEFCGGTHLDNIGQIGLFKIIGESAIAQGIRRIEAKTGLGALEYTNEQAKTLDKVANALRSPINEIVERAKTQTKKIKEMEKEIGSLRFDAIKGSVDSVISNAETFKKVKLVSHCFKDVDMNTLRKIADTIKQKAGSAIITLGSYTDDTASIIIAVSNDLVDKGIKANELITNIAPIINGQGGGKPQLAQAGSKEVKKVEGAIKDSTSIIKGSIDL